MSELYEIDKPEIKQQLKEIAGKIGSALPTGWGFLLHLFEFGSHEKPGSTFYISNADRKDAIKMLEEWIAKQQPDGEINPDHPVTKSVHNQWHKIVALLLLRLADGNRDRESVIITERDVSALAERDISVAVKDNGDGLRVFIVETEEARRLAREGHAVEGTS